jgi:hypothetical protein
MVGRRELTESAWTTIEPLLPQSGGRGGQWRNHRTVLSEILWTLCAGAPERHGPWQTARIGSIAGDARSCGIASSPTSRPILRRWARPSGRSTSTAPPHALISTPMARGFGAVRPTQNELAQPPHEALGRSRSGLTTKFLLSCDGRGRPLSSLITRGHRHDSTQLGPMLDGIRIRRAPDRGYRRRVQTPHRRQWLQVSALSPLAPRAADQTYPPTAARPTSATGSATGSPPGLRQRRLRPAQHGGPVHQSAQAVTRAGHPLREACRPLPGNGGRRRHRPVAPVVIRQPDPNWRAPVMGQRQAVA